MLKKNQLLAMFDEAYLEGLRNIHVRYQSVSTKAIQQHLYTNHGIINPTELLDDNGARTRELFHALKLIEALFDQQIEDVGCPLCMRTST